jgi:fucose 4-O-acetylase-like acetyltransferase
MKERELWVDIVKAICIIAMVMGHCSAPFIVYIYMFHMPTFFILSGYTSNVEKYQFKKYFLRKTATLLLPMYFINSLFIVFYAILDRMNLYTFVATDSYHGWRAALKSLYSLYPGTTEMGGATWFLLVLYIAELIYKVLQEIFHNEILITASAIIAGGAGYSFISKQFYLPFCIDLGLYACLYYAIGVVLKKANVFEKMNKKVTLPSCLLIVMYLGGVYFKGRLPMNWPTRAFDDPCIQLIGVVSCLFILYSIAKKMEVNTFLESLFSYIGRHTYTILTMHFLVFRMIVFVMVMFNKVPISSLAEFPLAIELCPYWLGITVITVLVCMIISWISEKNSILNYIFNAKF